MYFQPLATAADLKTELLKTVKPTGSAEVGLRADYTAALRREYRDMPLSGRGSAEYREIRDARRADLEAIIRTGISAENRALALDLACAICEESTWGAASSALGDDTHPDIDLYAAETACLMALAARECDFDVRARGRITYEIRRRILTPIIAHDDYPYMRGESERPLSVACDVIAAALLTEGDSSRLYAFLRRAVTTADKLTEADAPRPLAEALSDAVCATALWTMARAAAGPSAIGRALPKPGWLDMFLMAYMGGNAFADPLGEGTTDDINGADLFFLGATAGDDAIEALGAALYREKSRKISSINARLTSNLTGEMIKENRAVPRLRHASIAGGRMLSARGGGTLAILHSGGSGNPAGICIYVDDSPVLVTCPGDAPRINTVAAGNGMAIGDGDFDSERADMTMDATMCYPAAAGIRFFQRTLMLDRQDGSVRIIDMLETDRPGGIAYSFAAPFAPARTENGVRIGTAEMTWDAGARVNVRREQGQGAFPDGLYRLDIEFELRPGGNMLNFMIERS